MTQQNSKLVMMRFDPRAGWVKPSDEQIQFDEESPALPVSTHEDAVRAQKAEPVNAPAAGAHPAAESLTELGASILEVFNSLKLEDPRLAAWDQVNAAIARISDKMNEQKELEKRLHDLSIDIENLRNLASEFVNHAYQNEIEIHATSKIRVQIAESLNQRIKNALKP